MGCSIMALSIELDTKGSGLGSGAFNRQKDVGRAA